MTAQDHIEKIGAAITALEKATKEVRKASKDVVLKTQALHEALEAAQTDYLTAHANDGNVAAFSGGTNKPPVGYPDEPVEP